MKRALGILTVLVLAFCAVLPLYAAEELTEPKIIAIATEAAKANGIVTAEAQVVYDKDGTRWCETADLIGFEDKSPNHGILKGGFLKNYKIVLFDFVAPAKDVWVFIDKDTGEVFTVYQEE